MSGVVRAVVFDLDGTLLDSMGLVMRAYAEALRPYRPEMTDAEILRRLGGPPARFFADVLGETPQAAEALKQVEAQFVVHAGKVAAFPGMAEMLAELQPRCAVGLWTGRERVSTEQFLRTQGISDRIDASVCGDDLPSHKPDPAGLYEVLRRLGVTPEEAIFVGDADVDVLAGAAAGVRTILIEHGREVPAAVRGRAWRIVGTATETYTMLRQGLPGLVYKK